MTAFVLSSSGTTHRDPPAELTTNSKAILKKRYLDDGSVDDMWDRVSGGNPVYRNLMSSLRFLPNSPTLFNMGKNNGCTSSACFTFDVQDSMFGKGSIVDTRNKAIAVAKAGGGVGYYFGLLRPKGSPIKSIHRKACGPVTVLKDYHAISQLITQGGKRELAQMGVLNCDNQDIKEFIHCKNDDPQGLGSFNISVSWNDEWFNNVDFNKQVSVLKGTTKETSLWWEQCQSAWKHGCPGMLFHDTINRYNVNRHLGLIYCTNPCGEVPNRGTGEPCNLGSLSLPRYFNKHNRDINWTLLEEDVWNATFFMDDILTRNEFPHPDITEAAILTRRLGLGLMGWADLLAMLHTPYDSTPALEMADRVMSLVEEVSHGASEHMAKTDGPYKGYDPVKTQGPCRRNETSTSIAPTGTIAIIAGVWGSIEPHLGLGAHGEEELTRTTAEGMKMEDGVQEWVWQQLDGFVPKTADQIGTDWHVRHQAAFQKHTDLACSKTINMPNSATIEDVSNAYRLMYELGCKGGTIFRDGCRDEQVLVKKGKTKSVFQTGLTDSSSPSAPSILDSNGKHVTPLRRRHLPDEVPSIRVKLEVDGFEGYLHVGLFDDGTPGEIFFRASKGGSTINGFLDVWAIGFSLSLQHGTPLETLCRRYKGQRFDPAGATRNKEVPFCSSIPDFVARWLYNRFVAKAKVLKATDPVSSSLEINVTLPSSPSGSNRTGQMCPDCENELVWQGACMVCLVAGCGYSKCS